MPQLDGERCIVSVDGVVCWSDRNCAGVRFSPNWETRQVLRSASHALASKVSRRSIEGARTDGNARTEVGFHSNP